jgi:Domain of unknown function (DUF892)
MIVLALMGIVEEGEEVMTEGKKKDETAADLALIGAAQKVEHYEMSGYITARNLAQQLHLAPIVQLLQLSLGEEENADQLLNQLARPLMSAASAWSNPAVKRRCGRRSRMKSATGICLFFLERTAAWPGHRPQSGANLEAARSLVHSPHAGKGS